MSKTTTLGDCVRPTTNCHSPTPTVVYSQQMQRICGCSCLLWFCTSTPGGVIWTTPHRRRGKGTLGADKVGSCLCRRASVYPPVVQPEHRHLSPVTSPPSPRIATNRCVVPVSTVINRTDEQCGQRADNVG
jgi:hypothetical protein